VENIDKIPGVCGFVLPKDLGMEQAENLPDSTTEHAGRLEHVENNQRAGKDKVQGGGAEHPPCPQIPPAEQVILSTNTTCGTGDTVHKYHLQNR
tara:strand:- start:275 stop:556 length:282 start_codon:yes stop_codon:yes gene_type:complete